MTTSTNNKFNLNSQAKGEELTDEKRRLMNWYCPIKAKEQIIKALFHTLEPGFDEKENRTNIIKKYGSCDDENAPMCVGYIVLHDELPPNPCPCCEGDSETITYKKIDEFCTEFHLVYHGALSNKKKLLFSFKHHLRNIETYREKELKHAAEICEKDLQIEKLKKMYEELVRKQNSTG